MTVREPAGEQASGDDKPLLIAALNQAWAQYDAEINRGLQVVNYYIVATAVAATAYVAAINGKHELIAAAVALSEMTLTTVTFLILLRQRDAASPSALVLEELQGRVDTKLKMQSVRPTRSRPRFRRVGLVAPVTFGLVLLGNFAALLYAVIR